VIDVSEAEDSEVESRRTIPQLFDLALEMTAQYGEHVELGFDETYGFPVLIYGNWPNAQDAYSTFKVTDFEILE
jgi:hypothetical protein